MMSSTRQARGTSDNNIAPSGSSLETLPKKKIKRRKVRVKSSEVEDQRNESISNKTKSKASVAPVKEVRANAHLKQNSLLGAKRDIRLGKKSWQ